MGEWRTHYRGCGHTTRQTLERAGDGMIDAQGRCPDCRGERAAAAGPARPIRQGVRTNLACPVCGADLLLMTRRRDGKRFLACARWFDPKVNCRYTRDEVPQAILMAEAGAIALPGMPDGAEGTA